MVTETNNKSDDIKVTVLRKLYASGSGVSSKDTDALTYILEKTSRISGVLLLVSDLLDNNASLRTAIEETSIGLVTDAANSVQSHAARQSFVVRLSTLGALLDTGARAGHLSQNNVDLLINELTALASFVRDVTWNEGRKFIEARSLSLGVPESVFRQEQTGAGVGTYIRQQTDAQDVEQSQVIRADDREGRRHQDTVTMGDKSHHRDRVQEVQKDRRATILGIVQRKDRISVRDVANVIKDCSEKTLQRELLALVAQGVLKKEGERRWSTYSLA